MIELDLSSYKTREELEEYTKMLFIQVGMLQNQIKDIESQQTTIETPKDDISSEESLLLRELGYMDKLSQIGGLSLDETKQLKMIIDALVSLRRVEKGLPDEKKSRSKKQDTTKLLQMIKGGKLE